MRRVLVVSAGVLIGSSELAAQRMPELPDGRGRIVSASGETFTKAYRGVTPEALYRSSEAMFRRENITPTSFGAGNFRILYAASPAGSRIGNMKVESIFDCGGDKKSPIAKTAVLAVEVSSQVRPSGDGSEVVISVLATPTPPEDGSPAPVCTSKGTLERRLAPELKYKVTVVRAEVRRD